MPFLRPWHSESKMAKMKHQYRMYGWPGSHFAGKLRGYLNYKGLDYEEKSIWLYDLFVRIPRGTGARAMPALQSRDGEWFGDTPLIIETLEARHPENTIEVPTPRQRMAAMLLENWFDDSWIKVSVHTRWSYPENWDNLLKREWGKALLPLVPAPIAGQVAEATAKKAMSGSRQALGVRRGKLELLERWALQHLDTLEAHFGEHSYLLGERPTIADYALLACTSGHLNRDPWPKREWMAPRPNLTAWSERTARGDKASGELLADDAIAETLTPLFEPLFKEFPVFIDKSVALLERRVAKQGLGSGDSLPRGLGDVTYPMLDDEYTNMCLSYTLWRQQRLQRAYLALSDDERDSVDAWAARMGRADMFSMHLGPGLKRDGLQAALA